jgi:hypothetical protein
MNPAKDWTSRGRVANEIIIAYFMPPSTKIRFWAQLGMRGRIRAADFSAMGRE